ncbi:MAG TPA: hypothetical protein VJJ47_00710 [Candidatus Paceibacterota bacterium]
MRGAVIAESLADSRALNAVRVTSLEVTPEENVVERWHIFSVEADSAGVIAIAAAIKPGWYAHFWDGNRVTVVFSDGALSFSKDDAAGRAAAVERGLAHGIPAEQLDFKTN